MCIRPTTTISMHRTAPDLEPLDTPPLSMPLKIRSEQNSAITNPPISKPLKIRSEQSSETEISKPTTTTTSKPTPKVRRSLFDSEWATAEDTTPSPTPSTSPAPQEAKKSSNHKRPRKPKTGKQHQASKSTAKPSTSSPEAATSAPKPATKKGSIFDSIWAD